MLSGPLAFEALDFLIAASVWLGVEDIGEIVLFDLRFLVMTLASLVLVCLTMEVYCLLK